MNHLIQNKNLKVCISTKGAEMQSIVSEDSTEYLWQGNPVYWADRALTLFPYVARLYKGIYSIDGQIYGMNIHGFAPYLEFTLKGKKADSITLNLSDSPETLKQYPRKFSFDVCYSLYDNRIEITYTVVNKDEKTMFFGIGGHPGFNVPLAKGKKFEDYFLQFGDNLDVKKVGFSKNYFIDGTEEPFRLVSGEVLPLTHSLFDEDAIVLHNMSKKVSLICQNDSHSVTVEYGDMNYLGLWHCTNSDAPYVCIEPWSSLPSSEGELTEFEKKEDLILLLPGETYINRWSILINQ